LSALGDAAQGQRRQAGVFRGLEHRRVAGRQRTHHRAAEHLRRVVPGQDVRGHAVGLAQHHHVEVVQVGDLLAVQLVGRTAVVLEVARRHADVVARLADRLAGVACFQLRQILVLIQDELGHAHQHPPAFGGGAAAPLAVHGRAGGGHGAVDVGGRAAGNLVEGCARARVDDRQGVAVRGGEPLAADEVLLHGGAPVPGIRLDMRQAGWPVDACECARLRRPAASEIP
jgi:hypothetical protein